MSYRIELVPEARAEIRSLPAYVRAEALDVLEALAEDPRPARAKLLRGQADIYRIWVAGRWRLAYQVLEEEERIYVLRVRRKERIDYDSLTSVIHEEAAVYDAQEVRSNQPVSLDPGHSNDP